MPKEIVIKVYPLIIKIRVLYINKREARGVILLKNIKRIQDYIRLLIPL
jgi:hypothetical protein